MADIVCEQDYVCHDLLFRLDLSAAGEVSELMNTGAYETYLKEECEDH